MKPEAARIETEDNCRSPQGERGLKQGYRVPNYDEGRGAPPPARGGWNRRQTRSSAWVLGLPAGGAWVETKTVGGSKRWASPVAPRKGSVG